LVLKEMLVCFLVTRECFILDKLFPITTRKKRYSGFLGNWNHFGIKILFVQITMWSKNGGINRKK